MRVPDVATGALIGAAALSHAAWIVVDERAPRDLGRFYEALPDVFAGRGAASLLQPGGWYNGAMAVWLHAVGRSPNAFQAPDVVVFVALLLGIATIARRLGGPGAATVAVGIALGAPMIRGLARASWLHVPEAALLLGILGVLTIDPPLARRGAVGAVATLGALAVTLRPSALPWLAPLAWLAFSADRRRGALVTGVWGLAATPALVALWPYLAAKLTARDRYVADVPSLAGQLLVDLSGPPTAALAVAVAAAAWMAWRGGLRGGGTRGVLVAWTFTALLLWGVFRAGLDNFTIAAAAIAILAGDVLVRAPLPPRALGTALALLAGLGPALAWLSPRGGPIALVLGLPALPGLHNFDRPWFGPSDALVPALIRATCPGPCVIAVDDGLFEPNAEEPGRLGLFLLGFDDVTLLSLAEQPIDRTVDALVRWQTPPDETRRRDARHPRVPQAVEALVAAQRLSLAWQGADRQGTTRSWWTPSGTLPGAPVDPGDGAPSPGPPR